MKGKTESIINAHEKASGVERLISGSYLDPLDRSISNGKMRISVLGPNNDIKKTVYIHIDKSNNVIGVTR